MMMVMVEVVVVMIMLVTINNNNNDFDDGVGGDHGDNGHPEIPTRQGEEWDNDFVTFLP